MIDRRSLIAALAALAASAVLTAPGSASPADFDTELQAIQQAWAEANYRSANDDEKRKSLEALAAQAAAFSQRHPGRAEPLVWEGIVLSTYAGAKGGLGALRLARRARERLEAAMALDPDVLDGSAYTTLGVLYYKVPGFPLGFGDHRKAGALLRKALDINPEGIDPNFFYGEYLYEEGDYARALRFLEKALAAPPRPGRELADQGRREEISALIVKVREKLG